MTLNFLPLLFQYDFIWISGIISGCYFYHQGYGMTETCGIVSVEDPRTGVRHTGSAGTLVAGVEAQIISVDTLKPLPPTELGEIWVRGANMMQGIHELLVSLSILQ